LDFDWVLSFGVGHDALGVLLRRFQHCNLLLLAQPYRGV
jgi:hypothetical protein